MPYTTADARQGLLDTVAAAIERSVVALAALGEAYEQLDEQSAERLEDAAVSPRAARLRPRAAHLRGLCRAPRAACGATFAPATPGAPSAGARGFIDAATAAVAGADATLGELQDSLAPIEVGDAELRDGLREVRELLGPLGGRAREFVRTLGR